jgi:hypothetical protein
MGRPFGTEAAAAGLPAGYGLGLRHRDRHGVVGRCHGGSTIGYRAMLCLFPQHQKAFFVAMNTDSETADHERLNALLVGALEIAAAPPTPAGRPTENVSAWEGIYIPAPNRFATFEYLDTVLNFVHLSWDGSSLQLRSPQSEARFLVPLGGFIFRAPDRVTASHVLLTSSAGTQILSDGFQSYERVSLAKIFPMWMSLCAGVLGLAFILLAGFVRMLRRRLDLAMVVPFIAVTALLLPLPLFLRQSFLQLGDATVASVSLAVVTAMLPLGMFAGLVLQLRNRTSGLMTAVDIAATLAVLQWTIVLAAWDLLPLRLWR